MERSLARPIVFFFVVVPSAFGVGCDDVSVTAIDPALRVSPQQIDFGTAELGQSVAASVVLTSYAPVAVHLLDVRVSDDCNGCFTALNVPAAVGANSEFDLTLQFRASRIMVATGTVTIESDDPARPLQDVLLVGHGDDRRRPDIEVVPTSLDFGLVPPGGRGLRSFIIRSVGTNDLLVDRIRVVPETAPFRVTTSTPTPMNPGRVAPGAEVSVGVRVDMPNAQIVPQEASILIETNVVEVKNVEGHRGVVAVPLKAVANRPPVAVVGPDQAVEPWSRVRLDGSGSYDQDDPPNEPLAYEWTLLQRPPGSTTTLERGATSGPSFWADLTGVYTIQLVVVDSLGVASPTPAVVTVEALPTNAVRIELTWDHPDADLDLHLIRGGGAFCDCVTDVHYRDCGREPDWFPQSPGANPRLDVDDRGGFGPENINLDGDGPRKFIPTEEFRIAVHYYSTNEAISTWPTRVSNATVRVFIYGLLAGEFMRTMTDAGEVWVAAGLSWPSQTLLRDDTVVTGVRCGLL